MSDLPCDDGLLIPEVGPWAKRKYHFLQRYLDLFSTGMKRKWPERHYIDLFASAGLVRLRDSGEIVLGSALIAATVRDPFTSLHFCERDPAAAGALQARLARIGASDRARVVVGDVNERIADLLTPIPSRGALCVVFADPYGLHLDFETTRAVASKQCDLIVLLADNMDALRNWATYYAANPGSNLDRFMGEGGWRELLQSTSSSQQASALRDRYCERLREIGYAHFAFERVQNSRGLDIYSLLYASRHPTGLSFWRKASAVDEEGQRSLPFDG